MSYRIKFLRVQRAITYLLSYLFLELPRGIDFSLRGKTKGITLHGSHGYALTSKKALRNMLADIPFSNLSFLDIGSGKGGVIVYASQLGCKLSAGIEFEKELHETAVRNIRILKMEDRCSSYNMDARSFGNYGDFDIYFMFNPFDDDIYDAVVAAIVRQNRDAARTKYLICYGGANIEAVRKSQHFQLIKDAICPYRGNNFRIFKATNGARPIVG